MCDNRVISCFYCESLPDFYYETVTMINIHLQVQFIWD